MSDSRCGCSAVRGPGVRVLLSFVCSVCLLLPALPARAQYDLIHLGGAPGGYGQGVAVSGNYAFVASYTGGLRVYDVSDPGKPAFVAATNSGIPYVYDRSITLAAGYAYTGAIRDSDFHIYDISDPARPFPVNHVFSGNYVSELVVTGAVGYVANTAEGFSVYDFSNPSMPTRVTNFAGTSADCVTVAGGHAYVGGDGKLRIYSLADALAPVEVGSASAPSSAAIAVTAGYAYLAFPSGVDIFDVRNPSSPVKAGPWLSIGQVEDVLVSDHFLFVANWSAGVKMYDISNPLQPRLVAKANTTGYAPASQALCLSGNYLYVASGNTGFYVCAIRPRLQVSLDGANEPSISWPKAFAPGATVEHSGTLSAGDWSPIEGDPSYVDGYYVFKPPVGGSGFFRLRISP